MKHHDDAIALAIERYTGVDGVRAIVLIGSLARGDEREDSDVDLYLVVTPDAFAARASTERIGFYDSHAVARVPGFDVKVGTVENLRIAVDAASDETRACFDDARLVWSLDDEAGAEVMALVSRINRPGEEYWTRHQESFMALAALQAFYYMDEGRKLGNRLGEYSGAVHFAFALGRALLALNHVLYRGPKYLEQQLDPLPLAPVDVVARLRDFVGTPTLEVAAALMTETTALAEWPLASEDLLTRYLEDNELSWLTGVAPPEYR